MKNDKSMEQEILNSAESLFLEKGFTRTSTTEIAKKAGCNQALVHYYFRTKEKLFDEIFQKKVQLFLSSFIQIDKKDLSFEEKLKSRIRSHFKVLYENQQLPFLVMNELRQNPSRIIVIKENLSKDHLKIYTNFTRELDEEIEKGNIRPISAIDLIITMVSLNMTSIIIKPIMKEVLSMNEETYNIFLEKRIEENVTIIWEGIQPEKGETP